MGSSSSKSKCSPGDSPVDNPETYNASSSIVQEGSDKKGIKFKEVAVWSRPLPEKTVYNTIRWATLGAADVVVRPFMMEAGEPNHWAFIARGTSSGQSDVIKIPGAISIFMSVTKSWSF